MSLCSGWEGISFIFFVVGSELNRYAFISFLFSHILSVEPSLSNIDKKGVTDPFYAGGECKQSCKWACQTEMEESCEKTKNRRKTKLNV